MICDNCGYEHNSKSVCPKCGARAVFVDEDYLRRRKEWEEAQKKGEEQKPSFGSGIKYSTLEERDMPARPQEPDEEVDSVSIAIRAGIVKAFTSIVKFFKKFKKKRGRNNPVINDLKMAEGPDTIDESKLVLSHKIFKDKRKQILLTALGVVAAVVLVIVMVKIITGMDRTRVVYFDGHNVYATGSDAAILGNSEGCKFIEAGDGNYICVSSSGISIYSGGKKSEFEVSKATVYATSENGRVIIYTTEDNRADVMVYNAGEVTKLLTMKNNASVADCKLSNNGRYFALTACSTTDDTGNGQFDFFYGKIGGETTLLAENTDEKNILILKNNGQMIYLDLSTAGYGIVNSRSLVLYSDGKETVYCDKVNKVVIGENQEYITYITDESQVFYYKNDSKSAPVSVMEDATSLRDDGVILKNNNAYVLYEGELAPLKSKALTISRVYYNSTGEYYYGIDGQGNLVKLGEDESVIADGVTAIVELVNYEGIAYISDGKLFVMNDKGKTYEVASDVSDIDRVAYSRSTFYYMSEDKILRAVSLKGMKENSLGTITYFTVDK